FQTTEEPDESTGFPMRVKRILKCSILSDATEQDSVISVPFIPEASNDSDSLVLGYKEDTLQWDLPRSVSSEAVTYIRGLDSIPQSGPKRLAHFLKYLSHEDEFIAGDAYNEFAEASMEDIVGLRGELDRKWIVAQLRDDSLPTHRRRLCWTFLSQCGLPSDTSLFDEMLQKRDVDPTFDPGMDAAIACYISLGGETALARIESDFLSSQDAAYTDSFSAVSAIRVHGTDLDILPRERLAKALRQLLGRPDLADLVIPDLARWEDWSAIDQMVKLFRNSSEESHLARPAAVMYLKACPLPEATLALAKLKTIDPSAVEQAELSMMLYRGLPAVPVPPPETEDSIGVSQDQTAAEDDEPLDQARIARNPLSE
ncbi:MAG: hypothetical protein AAF664_25555, partial [Planctomycetota bacterium]